MGSEPASLLSSSSRVGKYLTEPSTLGPGSFLPLGPRRKTQAWRCDSSMLDPQIIQPEEATDTGGSQTLTFTLQESMPAAGLLRRRWEGMFLAPAIHIDVPMGHDLWIFLIRSPWFP